MVDPTKIRIQVSEDTINDKHNGECAKEGNNQGFLLKHTIIENSLGAT